MHQSNRPQAILAGLNGNVAEMFRKTLAVDVAPFDLEAVAASRSEHIGKRLGELGAIIGEVPQKFERVPVISLKDAVRNTNSEVVFSALRTEEADEFEIPLSSGRLLFSNASSNRMNPDAVLANAYTSAGEIKDYLGRDLNGHIVANGNCASIELAIGLYPLEKIGVRAVKATTMQGWSGSGATNIPKKYEGRTVPFDEIYENNDEKDKIETETPILLTKRGEIPEIIIEAFPQRGPWLSGHYINAEISFDNPTTAREINYRYKTFKAPKCLATYQDYSLLPQNLPVVPRSITLLEGEDPNKSLCLPPSSMRLYAHLAEFDHNNPDRAVIELSADNLGIGAAGSSVMAALYARELGYL